LTSGTWQGKEIRGMIKTLAVNCAPILVSSKEYGKAAEVTASDEMIMGAVLSLCEFSQLASQQNHSDLFIKALDDALKRLYKEEGISQEQNMTKSVQAKVDNLLAMECYQLHEQKVHKIRAAMVALVYGAMKVSSTKCRQFQVRQNRAQQADTTWSDADRQKAIK
jgi:hypothetical protein